MLVVVIVKTNLSFMCQNSPAGFDWAKLFSNEVRNAICRRKKELRELNELSCTVLKSLYNNTFVLTNQTQLNTHLNNM